eukprot:NODE_5776_length_612_cov_20.356701_g5612_i0.p1 GENE.NODE_5776_length_612_cov_20.356701_g5612_i0~~NODE_5776_length_612_cov_20.356701_g5612_i0.p1  ORF type:complete len:179 (+),score=49.41 NODE_5776_length_612_cov_20.356701_g5612_i0:58-537(+)
MNTISLFLVALIGVQSLNNFELARSCEELILSMNGAKWEEFEQNWISKLAPTGQFKVAGVETTSRMELKESLRLQWESSVISNMGAIVISSQAIGPNECIVQFVESYMVQGRRCGPILRRGYGIGVLNEKQEFVKWDDRADADEIQVQLDSCKNPSGEL